MLLSMFLHFLMQNSLSDKFFLCGYHSVLRTDRPKASRAFLAHEGYVTINESMACFMLVLFHTGWDYKEHPSLHSGPFCRPLATGLLLFLL